MPGNTPNGGRTAAAAATMHGRPCRAVHVCTHQCANCAQSWRIQHLLAGHHWRNRLHIAAARWTCNAGHQIAQRVRESSNAGWPPCASSAHGCARDEARASAGCCRPPPGASSAMDVQRRPPDRATCARNQQRWLAAMRIQCAWLCARSSARIGSTCVTLNGSGIQLAVGPQPLWLRNHNFGLAQGIMVKRLATSRHDPIGITNSACNNQLVVVSVQYGPFNTYIPIRSTTIGKSRVARDPTAMHTSWRSNSDIVSVTSIGYPRMRASDESSTTKHRLLHASGPHPIPPPNDPKALEASGLRGFLGCESVLYEKELEQFFDTTLVQNGDITGAVSGKFFSVSQSRFAEVFTLPTEGLVDFSDVLKNMVYDARSIFSKSGEQVSTHGKKKFMKYEYRLLNDILAKAITVKAESFDAVTNERFLMMTAIHFVLQVNWSKILFSVLKEMVDKTQKKAKGFATQICVLLKSIPAITMGAAVPFPTSKVLSITIVNSYIATNHTVDARGQSEEPSMANVAVVKRKSKSKRKPESTDETPVEVISEVARSKKRPAIEGNEPVIPKKKRTVKSKASPSKASLDVVPIAQDVVPLQIVEPNPAAKSPAPKLDIIGKVLEKTYMLTTDETEQGEQHIDETEIGDDFAQWLDESFKDSVSRDNEQVVVAKNIEKSIGSHKYDEEQMSLDDLLMQISDDMMLPLVTAAEVTKIRLGSSIEINEVQERDWYYASLPRISTHDKGKEPLEEDEPVKGNPARETVELICGDVDFVVQLRNQVMKDVVDFFHSFSLNKLSDLASLRDLKEKEKLMLSWAETDFLETVVKRQMYILAKYREMLLRKFLDSHRKYFTPGQPWTAMASQIIDLLSVSHSKSLEDLLA
ncbi:delphilin-like [Dorcoceras hygrometricum]|uniref:Delphilin-like n=1 Tax=Dorcoceras hygrometricum TaxID=472368 RepID=A0A2Z7D6I6_9LAMI|nr:delphilin-like [Dorcoceras hygrometricum]